MKFIQIQGLQEQEEQKHRVMFREEEVGGGQSLGTYPTTPGPAREPFPNIDIIINTCEVSGCTYHPQIL